MLKFLKKYFPDKYNGLSSSRVSGWVSEIDSGTGRDADQIRDDIAEHIIGVDLLMETFQITAADARKLILGKNEGGINFSDIASIPGYVEPVAGPPPPPPPGTPTPTSPGPHEDEEDDPSVGEGEFTILQGDEMKWYFDPDSRKWYVEYGLPNSDRTVFFEATFAEMDDLFGEGIRPTNFTRTTFAQLSAKEGSTFAGSIQEVKGSGLFHEEVERVIALAIDGGRLPDWAMDDPEIMDILYIAQAEEKSDAWILNQISKLKSFKERFPHLEELMDAGNLTLGEAIGSFLQYEAGVNAALKAAGLDFEATPDMVGDLLEAGHSLTVINSTVQGFARLKAYKPALEAFNAILIAQGLDPITSIEEMLDFVAGRSSQEVYDLWEASSLQEAAIGAGLGHLFSVQDAIDVAYATNQTLASATAGMAKAAELLLRLRHEIDVSKFGLTSDELLDISLGMTPRSGRNSAEINTSINRAIASAQGSLRKRATTAKSFGTGTPEQTGLSGARQET